MLKNPRFISAVAGAAFALSFLSFVPFAQAASLTPVQINAITNLLNAFGADSSVVANVQAVLEGTTPVSLPASVPTVGTSTPSVSIPGCSVLSGNLQVGFSGEDVTRLQAFLSKDKSIYPAGLVTGYYGAATEDAVRRWQAAHNIVATGTPDTTGFGVIGPRTFGEMKKEMEMECEGGDSNNDIMMSATSSTSSSSDSSSSDSSSSTTVATSSSEGN